MRILFLHGWTSVVGGRKPTFLKLHGHEVINPALPDDDFEDSIRIANAEYKKHQPDVIVGSSRGGAVAVNMNSSNTPLVLLCPAWKKWGSATTIKPNTTILHSRQDDVIPFADSEELLTNSGLPPARLIEVGADHRLADSESLSALEESCHEVFENRLRRLVWSFRQTIDVAKNANADAKPGSELPFIHHWPRNCCDSPYLFVFLYWLGHRNIIRMCGNTSFLGDLSEKHVWIDLDGITVDITADQFPGVDDKVIVSRHSPWHDNLEIIERRLWIRSDEDKVYKDHMRSTLGRIFHDILLPQLKLD